MTVQTTQEGYFQADWHRRASATSGRRHGRSISSRLEAAATISACLAALRADGDAAWRADAARAFAWFLGGNDLSLPLVDLETGSCRDGLHPDRPTKTEAANPWCPIFSASRRFVSLRS